MTQDAPMPEQIDPYAGQGGSYEMQPDGTRTLLFRTAEACPAEQPNEPMAESAPAGDAGDAKPQARHSR
jgi:hypothetical protein